MKKRSDKGSKAQMRISFGLIFSIILIIVFIAFAFFGIKHFLAAMNVGRATAFLDDVEYDINEMWRSSSGNIAKNYTAPKDVYGLCFEEKEEDSGENNVYFVYYNEQLGGPIDRDVGEIIEHLNWEEITTQAGYGLYGLCFEPDRFHKIELVLSKDYTDIDVTISRPAYATVTE